jgi:predicted adenine nucleotide alpha hydrolase (AANH) superfamily ATPase
VLVAEHFQSVGYEVAAWFFNPNIHPPEELARREETMAQAARAAGLPLLGGGPRSSLAEFLLRLARNRGRRCRGCYQLRLEQAAREAAEEGYQAFATTLTISPYQDLQAIQEIGESEAAAAGVRFAFADLRGHYHTSAERARGLQLYRQNYCGCVFSLLERAERRARRAIARALSPVA